MEDQTPTDYFSELEVKLASAHLWAELFNNGVFDEDDNPIAKVVNQKVRMFAHEQLAELMEGPKKRKKKADTSAAVTSILLSSIAKPKVNVARKPVAGAAKTQKKKETQAPVATDIFGQDTGEFIEQTFTDTNGAQMVRRYREFLDTETQKTYYLCFLVKKDRDGNETEHGDGNRYYKASNEVGGEYFKVISQQALPTGLKAVAPVTNAQFSAQSNLHSTQVLDVLRRSNEMHSQVNSMALKALGL